MFAAAAALIAGCTAGTSPHAAPNEAEDTPAAQCRAPVALVQPQLDPATMERVQGVVRDLGSHAWYADAPPAKGSVQPGGVYINWRASWDGTSPPGEQTNIRTNGVSDADSHATPRHDPLSDLLILRGVDAYLATGADDAPVLRLACLLRPVVEAEFANYGVDRGWIYSQLIDLSHLDSTGPWLSTAQHYAAMLSRRYLDPDTGAERDSSGTYRSDYAAESAAALVDAGSRFGQPDWTAQGERAAAYLVLHAANPTTGLFPGTLKIAAQDPLDKVVDPVVKVGEQAQVLDSLLQVFDRTQDPALLQAVNLAMSSMNGPATGLVDSQGGGYFYAVDADGTHLRTKYKETRQAWLLPLLQHMAAENHSDPAVVAHFASFVRDGLYRPDGDGYVYRVAPDLGDYTSRIDGATVAETWISAEATGIALVALIGPLA